MADTGETKVRCPVCRRLFAQAAIEGHIDRRHPEVGPERKPTTPDERRRNRRARIAQERQLEPFAGCMLAAVIGAVFTGCAAVVVWLVLRGGL